MHQLTIAGLCAAQCTVTAQAQSSAQPWTAGPGGKLTSITGSPFSDDVTGLAVNGKYLFGSAPAGMIDTYRIQSNGSLSYAASANALAHSDCSAGGPDFLFLDHTGASLYDFFPNGGAYCNNDAYQAWNINKSTGALTYLDSQMSGYPLPDYNFGFIGNNVYGYTSGCRGYTYAAISGYKRNSNGSLTYMNLAQVFPKAPKGDGWCPYLAIADPTNHLAVPMLLIKQGGDPAGSPMQLATYTVNTNTGAISTSSTYANMPKVSVGDVSALRMSPSGKLLAVGGTNGLQVFHFNGANPITLYTGLMSKVSITDIRWDNNNHLYAISRSGNRVIVFTVTPTNWKWVATYSVNHPYGIAVQPLPLPWQ